MTILNESGVPDVLSPLAAARSLPARLPGALVMIVGTRTEAYLAQSLSAALSPDAARDPLHYMILDADKPPEQGQMASRVIETCAGVSNPRMVFLISGRSAEMMGVDVRFEARVAARRLELPVKVLDPDPDPRSRSCLSTSLEDRALAALVEVCRESAPDRKPASVPASKRGGFLGGFLGRDRAPDRGVRRNPVVLLGTSREAAVDLSADLRRVGVEVSGSVPAIEPSSGSVAGEMPPIGEGTVVAPLDPHLTAACRTAEGRGAKVVRTLSPIGVDGTARFIQDVAAAVGISVSEMGRAREAWESLDPLRNRIRGKRVFLAGDTGFELALARFLADAGALVIEVGTPRLERRAMSSDLHSLGAGVDVVESPDGWGQIGRIDAARPDVVICSQGLYIPLVSRGHLCRTSLDLRRIGIHGYEGARRVLDLLVQTFERAEALDALDL